MLDSIFAQLREETNERMAVVIVEVAFTGTNVKTSFHLTACQDFANERQLIVLVIIRNVQVYTIEQKPREWCRTPDKESLSKQ